MKRWEHLAQLLAPRNPLLGAELGVEKGKISEFLLHTFPNLQMLCIDTWKDMDGIKAEAMQRLAPFKERNRVAILQMDSLEAAKAAENEAFDFVFIDTTRTYEDTKANIDAWFDKVKIGGFLCGAGYSHKSTGVEKAVAESFNLLHVLKGAEEIWVVQR